MLKTKTCIYSLEFLLHFSPRKGYLSYSAKNTLSNKQTTDPVKVQKLRSPLFASQPVSLTERERMVLCSSAGIYHTSGWGYLTRSGMETKGSVRGHLLQSVLPSCNSHTPMSKKSPAESGFLCRNISREKKSLYQNARKSKYLRSIKYYN